MIQQTPWRSRLAQWRGDYGPQSLAIGCPTGLNLVGIAIGVTQQGAGFFRTPLGVITLLLCIGTIGGIAWLVRQQPRMSALKDELAKRDALVHALEGRIQLLEGQLSSWEQDSQVDIFEQWRAVLAGLAQALGFGHDYRISAYKHSGRFFVELGRFSDNPEYAKRGRGYYPQDEGCIAKAWQQGSVHIDQLPDPETSLQSYCDALAQRQVQIPLETARSLRMPSRSYVGLTVRDGTTLRRPLAVLMFESTRTNVLQYDRIRAAVEAKQIELAGFVQLLKAQEPSLAEATKEGL